MPDGNQFEQLSAMADAMEQQFDDTIYRISHDLQAPVRGLQTIPDWVVEDLVDAGLDLPPSVIANLELLRRQSKRLNSMITDLLVYSRIGRDRTGFSGDLDHLISGIFSDTERSDQFRLTTSLDAQMPGMIAEDLRVLLDALISNAIKHHPSDSGSVNVATWNEGDMVVLSVTDDGAGIPEADRELVRAFMTKLCSRDEVEGSGMGLAIAERVCHIYGGDLDIDADDTGQGCRIRVSLPTPLQARKGGIANRLLTSGSA